MGRAARARALFATWANGFAVCTCIHARLSAYALDAPSCSGAAETYALDVALRGAGANSRVRGRAVV